LLQGQPRFCRLASGNNDGEEFITPVQLFKQAPSAARISLKFRMLMFLGRIFCLAVYVLFIIVPIIIPIYTGQFKDFQAVVNETIFYLSGYCH